MKLPKLWRVKRAKKAIGAFHVTWKGERINLATQDAAEALKRAREVVTKGRKKFRDDADGAAESLIAAVRDVPPTPPPASTAPWAPVDFGPPAPALPPIPNEAPPPPPPDMSGAPAASGEWHANLSDAAAAGSQQSDTPPPPVDIPSDAELAEGGVKLQIWAAETYVRAKVYKGFQAPQIADEAKAALAAEWEKIIAFSGVGAMLPPWVPGLAIPILSLVAATKAMAEVFAEQATQQKAAAGGTADAGAPGAA